MDSIEENDHQLESSLIQFDSIRESNAESNTTDSDFKQFLKGEENINSFDCEFIETALVNQQTKKADSAIIPQNDYVKILDDLTIDPHQE